MVTSTQEATTGIVRTPLLWTANEKLSIRPATVSKWRTRFATNGIAGLADAPRSGKPPTYTDEAERRVLSQLDEDPPPGYARWNGPLPARALGDASETQVWRILRRPGTTTLFAALDVATGLVKTGHFKRRRRVEFLSFMNQVVADYPEREIHVILDNLNTHKPKRDLWLARHPKVHFRFTPTHGSWLNQVEVWFSVLTRAALQGAGFTSPEQVRSAIEGFVAAYNPTAEPFQWRKGEVNNTPLKRKYAELCR